MSIRLAIEEALAALEKEGVTPERIVLPADDFSKLVAEFGGSFPKWRGDAVGIKDASPIFFNEVPIEKGKKKP